MIINLFYLKHISLFRLLCPLCETLHSAFWAVGNCEDKRNEDQEFNHVYLTGGNTSAGRKKLFFALIEMNENSYIET